MRKFLVSAIFLVTLAFAIPIEHKYDKLFRFYSLSLVPQGLEISPQFDKKIYFYATDLIALILLTLGLFWYRIPVHKFFKNPLWLIFLCAASSIIASPFIHYPVAYIRLLQLATPLILVSFLIHAYTPEEKEKITQMIWMALVAAAVIQSCIAIAQYIHQAPIGLRLLGESSSIQTVKMSDGTRWIFDRLTHWRSPICAIMRASGTFGHCNVLGGFLAVSILATYGLIVQAKKGRFLWALTLPLQFFALSLTYSRAALYAWAIGTVIWFVQKWDRLIAITMVCTVLLSAGILSHQYLQRGGIVSSTAVSKASDAIRIFHQKMAFKIIQKKPLLGLGFGQFTERAQTFFPPETNPYVRATAPHNIFLFLACETGLISLAAFLYFIASALFCWYRTRPTTETITLSSMFIALLFIGCCDFYPLLFQQGKLLFFTTVGLFAAHLQSSKQREPLHV